MQLSGLVIERLNAAIVLFWWRPDGHGRGDDEPSSQYEPGVQAWQSVLPDSCWYLPASHLAHALCPGRGCLLPAEHCVGSVEPGAQDEPAGHSTQAVAPLADWYLPAVHESQLLWPVVTLKEAGLHVE